MYKQLDAQKEAAHKRMSQAIWSSVGGLVIGGAMSSMTGGLLTKGVKKNHRQLCYDKSQRFVHFK